MIKIFVTFEPQTSILDDFEFYEKRQQDHELRKLRNQLKKKKQPPAKLHTDSPLRNNSKMKLFSRNKRYPSSENSDDAPGLFGNFDAPGEEEGEEAEEIKKEIEDDEDEEKPLRIYECNSQGRSLSPMGIFPADEPLRGPPPKECRDGQG